MKGDKGIVISGTKMLIDILIYKGFVDHFYDFWIQKSHYFYDFRIQKFVDQFYDSGSRNGSIFAVSGSKIAAFLQLLDPEILVHFLDPETEPFP